MGSIPAEHDRGGPVRDAAMQGMQRPASAWCPDETFGMPATASHPAASWFVRLLPWRRSHPSCCAALLPAAGQNRRNQSRGG